MKVIKVPSDTTIDIPGWLMKSKRKSMKNVQEVTTDGVLSSKKKHYCKNQRKWTPFSATSPNLKSYSSRPDGGTYSGSPSSSVSNGSETSEGASSLLSPSESYASSGEGLLTLAGGRGPRGGCGGFKLRASETQRRHFYMGSTRQEKDLFATLMYLLKERIQWEEKEKFSPKTL